jgi:simple sugar transport system ATP-binding protein
VGYIPAERKAIGSIGELSIADNLVLADYAQAPYSHSGWLDHAAIQEFARSCVKDFDIRTPSPRTRAELLSGGNLQKVVLARELSSRPDLLICTQPTRGLDVGAIEYVHKRLLDERERGAAILLISTELDEILTLSDRIAVICQGRIMGIVPNQNIDLDQIGLMMAGSLQLPI